MWRPVARRLRRFVTPPSAVLRSPRAISRCRRGCSAPIDVRSYLDGLVARGATPGLQYVLVDAARTRVAYAGGLADIRGHVPMAHDTTMMAYSMTKTITAVAVLRLIDGATSGWMTPSTATFQRSRTAPR